MRFALATKAYCRGPPRVGQHLSRSREILAVVRVLHVTKKFPPSIGGDATAVSALIRAQGTLGIDAEVLAYRAAGIEETERVHPVGPIQTSQQLDRIGIRRVRAMRAMGRWADDHLRHPRPDVIHAHAADVGFAVARQAHAQGVPIILTCHGVWFSVRNRLSPLGWLERSLIRGGHFAAITSVDRTSVESLRNAGFDLAELVPNGVDLKEFDGISAKQGPFRFLFVGRHVHQKGLDVLVKATAHLRDGGGPAFVVEIAGDGPLTTSIKHMTEQLHLGDTIRFLGPLPRPLLQDAFQRADAFVLPSRYEGFPIAVFEAWAARLPVIATSVGGLRDLADEGNAILVPPDDPDALERSMARLLGDGPLREQLGRRGHDLVERAYTWDAIAMKYETIYRRSMSRPGATTP